MDNPAAGAASAVKRVPKWAWIAGAGVTGGVIFYKYTHRSAPDTASSTDATAPADYAQTYSPLGTVTATPVDNPASFDSVPPASGLAISDVTDLLDSLSGAQAAAAAAQPPPIGA